MSFKFNPITGQLDLKTSEPEFVFTNNPFSGYARHSLGNLDDMSEDFYNLVDCGELPILGTKAIIDLGELT